MCLLLPFPSVFCLFARPFLTFQSSPRCGPPLLTDLEKDLARQKGAIAKEFDLAKKKCAGEIQVARTPSCVCADALPDNGASLAANLIPLHLRVCKQACEKLAASKLAEYNKELAEDSEWRKRVCQITTVLVASASRKVSQDVVSSHVRCAGAQQQ